jgi:hypothetical protein
MLVAAVRLAIGAPAAIPVVWECYSIYQPRVASTQGVYLLVGAASDDEQQASWSLVLKVLAATPDNAPPLEANLYRSGFLASLQRGLVAPRCFGVVALAGGLSGIWLEYLHDTNAPRWSIKRFGLAAYHLGMFNATQTLRGKLSAWPWLRHIDWRALIEGCADSMSQFQAVREHPLVRRAYPAAVAQGFMQLWASRHTLLDALEHTSYVVCHGDAQRRNLFGCSGADGDACTVAIDWANIGARPVGADIVTLVHQALIYFDVDVDAVAHLDEEVFGRYLSGLSAAGWTGDPREVRFAYATQMALGLGLLELGWVLRVALDEHRQRRVEALFGRSLDQILDRRAAIGCFLLMLAREAYAFVETAS